MSLTQFDRVVERRLSSLHHRLARLCAGAADPSEIALVELMIDDLARVRRENAGPRLL